MCVHVNVLKWRSKINKITPLYFIVVYLSMNNIEKNVLGLLGFIISCIYVCVCVR